MQSKLIKQNYLTLERLQLNVNRQAYRRPVLPDIRTQLKGNSYLRHIKNHSKSIEMRPLNEIGQLKTSEYDFSTLEMSRRPQGSMSKQDLNRAFGYRNSKSQLATIQGVPEEEASSSEKVDKRKERV